MQQIAAERHDFGAEAIQRFMHQIIVIAVTRAFVQAHHPIGIPTAVAHKTPEEVVTPGDTVDNAALRRVQYLENSRFQFRRNALVGINHQHPVVSGVILCALALNAIASPVGIAIDPRAEATGQLDGIVGTAGVQHHHFIRPAYRRQAIGEQVGGVFGDHHDGESGRH